MIQRASEHLDATISQHREGLRISSRLTSYFRQKHQPMAVDVLPDEVIATLNGVGVKCVLMGTHALNTWRSQSRATHDVDVLVRKKDFRKAVKALRQAYPNLTVSELPVVTRLSDPATGLEVIDILRPAQPVFQMVFRHTIAVGDTHEIPDMEMCLASKFAAMVSPNRPMERKLVDGGDFVDVVKHNRDRLDLRKLKQLADKVYPNGGAEILQLINDIDAGRMIRL